MSRFNPSVYGPLNQRGLGKQITNKFFGVHSSFVGNSTTVTKLISLGLEIGTYRLKDAGADWSSVETSNGVYNWTTFDSIVNDCFANGVDVIYTFCTPPAWTGSGQFPTSLANFQSFVTAVVQRYKGKIKYYEVWNEPDLDWNVSAWTASLLLQYTQAVYSIVHSNDSNAKVLSPAFYAVDSQLVQYMQTVQGAGGSGSCFDVVSMHMYPQVTLGEQPESIIQKVGYLRTILAENGISDIPIMITEAGYGSGSQVVKDQGGHGWSNGMFIGETVVQNATTSPTATFPSQSFQSTSAGTSPLTQNQEVALLSRLYLSGIVTGVERFVHYAEQYGTPYSWINMVSNANAIRSAGTATINLMDYVSGSLFLGYQQTKDGIHAALFESQANGQGYLILWAVDGFVQTFDLEKLWGVVSVVDLLGNVVNNADTAYIGSTIQVPNVLSSADNGMGIPVVVTLTARSNQDFLSVWRALNDTNEYVDLLYNGDLSLVEPNSTLTYPKIAGWNLTSDDGSTTLTFYTGTDNPVGSTAYQIQPLNGANQVQLYQRLFERLKPNHRYRLGLIYKCTGTNTWTLGVYVNNNGNALYKWAIPGENSSEIMTQNSSNDAYLMQTSGFQTVYRDFVYSPFDRTIPLNMNVVLNSNGGSAPIVIAGIFLREIRNVSTIEDNPSKGRRTLVATGQPRRGTVFIGDVIEYVGSSAATSGIQSYVTGEGTFGTLTGVTGSISNNGAGSTSSYILTISGGTLNVGDIVTVGSDTTHYYITQVLSSTQYLMHTYAVTAQTNATVSYVKPSLYSVSFYKAGAYAETITNGVTSWTHTNSGSFVQQISISGGNVSQINFVRQGVSQNLGVTSGMFLLAPGDALSITFTAAYAGTPVLYVIPM